MRTTSGRAAGARSSSSRPLPTDTTRYPSGSSMLSSAWLSHVPELAISTAGGRGNGVPLTGGQPAAVFRGSRPAGVHDSLRDARPDVEPAARHLLDGLGEVFPRLGLEHEPPHARAYRVRHQTVLLERRQHHDLGFR